jgi:hypothetical protein
MPASSPRRSTQHTPIASPGFLITDFSNRPGAQNSRTQLADSGPARVDGGVAFGAITSLVLPEGFVMGYANHIGRVGALAVTLGVGWAVASAPGVAYADTSGSADTSQSSTNVKSRSAGDGDNAGTATDDTAASKDSEAASSADNDAAAKAKATAADDEPVQKPAKSRNGKRSTSRADADVSDHEASDASEVGDDAEGAEDSGATATAAPTQAATVNETTVNETKTQGAKSEAPTTPATTNAKPSLVSVLSDAVADLLKPLPERTPVSPLQGSTFLASLAAARDELERNASSRSLGSTSQDATTLDVDTPNVLVIGVDGTNLARVLAILGDNSNFFKLIQGSTTAASTIVGHTTISNPSWSSILTGAWGEKTGVVNNVFTPWTYNKWPSVFTQLETRNPAISTTSIANWNVISGIADSGLGADNLINVSQEPDDPRWFKTDNKVGELTKAAIEAAQDDIANFMFSYFVGVDENGHMFGADSPEYAAALLNFDNNLGLIMGAVEEWERVNEEQWTIMVVTDHGHQPQKGLGHGFQSPDETTTFVIANNPDLFTPGGVNLRYSIVDVTPTVMKLFGFTPAGNSDGVSLTDLGDSTVTPVNNTTALRQALNDAIAMFGYPDIGTNIALTVRTIATTIPYYVDNITNGIVAALQGIAAQQIFLISPLAALAIIPVDIIGDLTYIATNIFAQIVARLTGVTGASIFPLQRPATPTFPEPPAESSTPDLLAVACSDGRVTAAVFSCGVPTIAA